MSDDINSPDIDPDRLTMKPLLGELVQEAVKLAIIDSVSFGSLSEMGVDAYFEHTKKRRAALYVNIFNVTDEEWASINPMALAMNVACRLLGSGGWDVRGVYGGNASPGDLLEATFGKPYSHPAQGVIDGLKDAGFDLEEPEGGEVGA